MPAAIGLLQILLVGLLVYWLWLVLYSVIALTRPPRRTYAWALAKNIPGDPSECDQPCAFETFVLKTQSAEIECWRVKGQCPHGPVVVMTHGWGSSKQGGLKRLAGVLAGASEVILWDLPGHGESAGACRLGTSEHQELCALIEHVGHDQEIVLFGWSMGAGICLRAASELSDRARILCVICEAPYIHAITPARNVIGLRGFPTRFNLPAAFVYLGIRFGLGPSWKGFARDEIAAQLSVPVVVLHGQQDPVCPSSDGERIAQAASQGRCELIADAGHNNLWSDPRFREQSSQVVLGSIRDAASTQSA